MADNFGGHCLSNMAAWVGCGKFTAAKNGARGPGCMAPGAFSGVGTTVAIPGTGAGITDPQTTLGSSPRTPKYWMEPVMFLQKPFALTLRREIALILLVKLLAVVALYQLFFDEPVTAIEASWLAPLEADVDRVSTQPDPRIETEEETP
ncbi:cytochrome oxidase putative small subunit CydP [Pseudomaricurvus sp. HS19]|uniref:cytochrome oxidase putative small subunit CydP n=1 Tax=Pseudomaricurvus sp. HS19 TaxID=2692626 RepID=UPI00136FA96D|nr:cytochrome oxidase putative small subunit CydP [Pseudomaricurvus sp. HS19]MYM63298.1 hypothetical protein [Pseudomaricurvus sp. HS19]